ncbi:hypothetical protein ST37_00220 [Vibrio sp. qd031]|uniref:histidine phosphatase family protein n=1 Tax=Vibrio sp. qd031 TaxID=1603038 RepID=UPI000A107219|nr:histidine phosphatase family protein [Vibrio sp. qd031]ORT52767.1 hypothetical protein ST37_00220 [Vibrio sp. qd031]
MSQPIEITLLRHGRSLADDEKRCEGRYDSPLTEVGVEQTKRRLAHWQEEGRSFDTVVSSPLQRAMSAASIIANGLNLPLDVGVNWQEKDNGSIAGLTFADADKRFPKASFVNPYEAYIKSASDGESEVELHCRSLLALQHILRSGHSKVLIVSHGKMINAAVSAALGIKPTANTPSVIFALGDLSFIDLVYYPTTDVWLVKQLNHLTT